VYHFESEVDLVQQGHGCRHQPKVHSKRNPNALSMWPNLSWIEEPQNAAAGFCTSGFHVHSTAFSKTGHSTRSCLAVELITTPRTILRWVPVAYPAARFHGCRTKIGFRRDPGLFLMDLSKGCSVLVLIARVGYCFESRC
jgi:hypothetical protein